MTPAAAEIADRGLVLRATVGSSAHGLHVPGTDDRDEMGVCIEPPEYVIGLRHFEQHIYRTAEERRRHTPEADQRYHGRTPPSEAGDLDLVVYSLRKYARLAAQGNPTILILLFAPDAEMTGLGAELRAYRDMFASKQAGHRFLGYLRAQKERLLGRRGQMRVTRTELVEKHGHDSKYAMHMVRLGFQGCEYLRDGRLTLPMRDDDRAICMDIRRGEWSLEQVARLVEQLELELQRRLEASSLPDHPDHERINRWLVEAHMQFWGGRR